MKILVWITSGIIIYFMKEKCTDPQLYANIHQSQDLAETKSIRNLAM